MNNIILIDICGTIFNSNTTFDFIDSYSNSHGYRLLRRVMHTLPWRILNKISVKLSGLDITRILALKTLSGYSRAELLTWADEFYETVLNAKINDQVLSLIEDFRHNGCQLILASATLDFMAQTVAQKLNIKDYIATELQYNKDICMGKMKTDRLGHKLSALIDMGIEPPYRATITDNYSDSDILSHSQQQIIILSKHNESRWRQIVDNHKLTNVKFMYV